MAKSSAIVVGVVLLGMTSSSGCSGSSSGAGAGQIPEGQFVSRFVDTVCDSLEPCCQQAGFPYDEATCKGLGKSQVGALLGGPHKTYDAAAGARCIAELAAALKDCQEAASIQAPSCTAVYNGSLAPGSTCERSDECRRPAAGWADCKSNYGEFGICIARERGAEGQPCDTTCLADGPSTQCTGSASSITGTACFMNDGLYCDQTCKPLIAPGQPCQSIGCTVGHVCVDSSCVALPVQGEPCFDGYRCGEGFYCATTGSCEALLAPGEPCTSYSHCLSGQCDTQGVCGDGARATEKSCSGH